MPSTNPRFKRGIYEIFYSWQRITGSLCIVRIDRLHRSATVARSHETFLWASLLQMRRLSCYVALFEHSPTIPNDSRIVVNVVICPHGWRSFVIWSQANASPNSPVTRCFIILRENWNGGEIAKKDWKEKIGEKTGFRWGKQRNVWECNLFKMLELS